MEQVGVRELEEKVRVGLVPPDWVGTTVDPNRRAREHQETYRNANATMYYAETSNMKYAENRLFNMCGRRGGCWRNVQKRSNRSESRGYVYAIFPRFL